MFGEDERLLKSMDKDNATTQEEGLIEIYKKLRPGEPPTVDSASSLLKSLFFDPKRYDLAKVGRYKFNKKLSLFDRIEGCIAAENIIHPTTGEILAEEGQKISRKLAKIINNSGLRAVNVIGQDEKTVRVIGNHFVELDAFMDPEGLNIHERVHYPTLKEIMDAAESEAEMRATIKERARDLVPKNIIIDDIIASIFLHFKPCSWHW